MASVQCKIHGLQLGHPLGCPHLSSDLLARGSIGSYRLFACDYLDDGSVELDIVICNSCIASFDLAHAASIDASSLEAVGVIPLCSECWRDASNRTTLR
jgi:hypothetical protein